jgi:hypothetical protein
MIPSAHISEALVHFSFFQSSGARYKGVPTGALYSRLSPGVGIGVSISSF